MGFTDKMSHAVALQIVNDVFFVKYEPTIKEDNTWYKNLNEFLVVEWDRLQTIRFSENEFTDMEEEMIARDAMDILLDKLNIDEDEFEEYEQEVDWMKFDDIIGYYTCHLYFNVFHLSYY
jgi:hypothetical protein